MRKILALTLAAGIAGLPMVPAAAQGVIGQGLAVQEVAALPDRPAGAQVIEGPGPFERLLQARLTEIEVQLSSDRHLDYSARQDLHAEQAWLYAQLARVNAADLTLD